MDKVFCVYIMTNKMNGTLYIGVTSNLLKRVYEHKNKVIEGFTSKYNLDKLVYFEWGSGAEGAILREKELKRRRRSWKITLIESQNPTWNDLYPGLVGEE